MSLPRTFRRLGWIAFALMWIPFIGIFVGMWGMPSGDYAWSEIPDLTQRSIVATGLFFAATFLFLFGGMALGAMRNQSLRRNGLPAQATIVEVTDTGATINESPVVRMVLNVEAPGVPTFRAETERLVSRLQVHQLVPGAVVEVRYDPVSQDVAVV